MNLAVGVLVILLIAFPSTAVAASIVINIYYPAERDALLQLRDSLYSSVNLHKVWTGPPCNSNQSRWDGIQCWKGHVVGVVLDEIRLQGSLPPDFTQNLTFLTILSLRNNLLYGPLPNLTNLQYIGQVFLSENNFTGQIPSDYTQLPTLTNLELQQNQLSGEIPPFNQQNLQSFNVSFNRLQGPIPETSALQSFPASSYQSNPGLCGGPSNKQCSSSSPATAPVAPPPFTAPPPTTNQPRPHSIVLPAPSSPQGKESKGLKTWNLALIAAAAGVVPIFAMFVALCYYRRVHRKKSATEESSPVLGAPAGAAAGVATSTKKKSPLWKSEDPEKSIELEFFDKSIPIFDLDDLLRASAGVIGKGKLGTTYRASLESGLVVAVKRVKNTNGLSKNEFIQQMQLLGNIRHDNLARMICLHYSRDEKLVIYEFVPNSSNLFQLLHDKRRMNGVPLNWAARFSIIKDVAKGLNYLHQYIPSHQVPHANLKSSNVLMYLQGQTYRTKLTDFGYFPLSPYRKSLGKLAVARTPEFHQGRRLTHEADVYCFGILLLEIITGKVPGGASPGNESEVDLSVWVRTVLNTDWSTVLDAEMVSSREGHDGMLKIAELALQCTDNVPEKRPPMNGVLKRIFEIEQKSS